MSNHNPIDLMNAYYIAINLQDILYGVELVLYFMTIRAVLMRRRKWERTDVFCVLFSTVMLFLITVWIALSSLYGQETWVIQSGYPGGAGAFYISNQTLWWMDLERVTVVILQLMTDALLIHRCWVLYDKACVVIIVTWTLWFATLVLGILQNWAFDTIGGGYMADAAFRLGLAYYTACVVSNTTLTSLICYRVVSHGKMVRAELGPGYSSMYFAIVEVIIGSALPFTLCGVTLLVTLGSSSVGAVPLAAVYFVMTCISPQMLILWVLVGRGSEQGKRGFASTRSDVKFQHWSVIRSDGREGTLHLQPLSEVYSPDSSHDTTASGRVCVSP